jgi:hypothetical protein
VSRSVRTEALLVAALAAAALLGTPSRPAWLRLAALIFGILNVVCSPPGTFWVTSIAIGAVMATLVWPDALAGPMVLLGGLVWPTAFVIGWSLATRPLPHEESSTTQSPATPARFAVAAIIGAVALAAIAYRLLVVHHLGQTAALFIGLPAILAVVVVFWVSPRSATGVACKAVTIGLLVSLLFLGEGLLCILMAAPLFYVLAILIGTGVELAQRHRRSRSRSVLSCVGLLALMTMSLEGVTGATTFHRDQWVSVSRAVPFSSAAVQRALFELPRFDRPLPFLLRAGFPRPVSSGIDASAGGTRWMIGVRGGELRLEGGHWKEPRTGTLVLELEEFRPGTARWRAVSDDSHMPHYLTWQEARVEWEAIGPDTTAVTFSLRFRRDLDPAWYFGPLERVAATLAADYLIDSLATPRSPW